jgi:hypothetical protein
MSQEIIYTSAPKGLKPGSRGFCTVVSTHGLAKNLADSLESLSGYRHVYPPQSPEAPLNPIVYSHLRLTVGGRPYHVLSRIADAGLDYTQRTNKFAHHVALDPMELPTGGPAWLLAQPGFMATGWDNQPQVRPVGPQPPHGDQPPQICQAWQRLTGDAGWAGLLAETALPNTNRNAVIMTRPGMDVLSLLVEALILVPAPLRWQVTFSTYFTKLPPGVNCKWRCVLEGTPEALALARSPNTLLVDLTRPLGKAIGDRLVDAARSGMAANITYESSTTSNTGFDQPSSDAELESLLAEEAAAAHPSAAPGGSVPHDAPLRIGPPPRGRGSELPAVRQKSASPRTTGSSPNRKRIVLAVTLLVVVAGGMLTWLGRNWSRLSDVVANRVEDSQAKSPDQGAKPVETIKDSKIATDEKAVVNFTMNSTSEGPVGKTEVHSSGESTNKPASKVTEPVVTRPKADKNYEKTNPPTTEVDIIQKEWDAIPAEIDLMSQQVKDSPPIPLFSVSNDFTLKLLEPINSSEGSVSIFGKGFRPKLLAEWKLSIVTESSNPSAVPLILADLKREGKDLYLARKSFLKAHEQKWSLLQNYSLLVSSKNKNGDSKYPPRQINFRKPTVDSTKTNLLTGIQQDIKVNGLPKGAFLKMAVAGNCGDLQPSLSNKKPNQYKLDFIDSSAISTGVYIDLSIVHQNDFTVAIEGKKPRAITPESKLPVDLSIGTCKNKRESLRMENDKIDSEINRLEDAITKENNKSVVGKLKQSLSNKRELQQQNQKDINEWAKLESVLGCLDEKQNLTISVYIVLTENREAKLFDLSLVAPQSGR